MDGEESPDTLLPQGEIKTIRANCPPQQCERCEQKRSDPKGPGGPNPNVEGLVPL
ncbi:hypothetical protein M1295_01230 [Patescibacteria group bacterium]|nr:hypothetical protein [Patescibacteria group bacterium]